MTSSLLPWACERCTLTPTMATSVMSRSGGWSNWGSPCGLTANCLLARASVRRPREAMAVWCASSATRASSVMGTTAPVASTTWLHAATTYSGAPW